jgi:hypothetical protein
LICTAESTTNWAVSAANSLAIAAWPASACCCCVSANAVTAQPI